MRGEIGDQEQDSKCYETRASGPECITLARKDQRERSVLIRTDEIDEVIAVLIRVKGWKQS